MLFLSLQFRILISYVKKLKYKVGDSCEPTPNPGVSESVGVEIRKRPESGLSLGVPNLRTRTSKGSDRNVESPDVKTLEYRSG